jgi:signal transduction histidine kinase
MDLEVFSKKVRVLVIDDDEEDFFILKKTFEKIPQSPFVLDWTPSYDEGLRQIGEKRHDIFLIDYRLGAHTGLDLLKQAEAERRSEPFILLTGTDDRDVEWRSMRLAAADYLRKSSISSEVLSRTLYYALQRKQIERQRLQHLMDLNRSKDEFISIASHQLRTPATAVKQYLGMLIEGFVGDVEPRQLAMVAKAYENNERQLRIVSDLLKVAQVDAGQVMLKKEEVSLNSLIEDIIHDFSGVLNDRDQTIAFYRGADDPKVTIDLNSIRMVFENLIDNASKYSEEGKQITITVENEKSAIVVAIADEGVGIRAGDRHRLFEKFSRLDNSLSTKVGGTGLGLYWAKKIVTLHDGTITHAPNTPSGSVFSVGIPKNTEEM